MKLIRRISINFWAVRILAWLGVLVYVVQAWYYAHSQRSVLDEGLYLYGGYLFTSGKQTPFQDYGFFTWQMPLAFLIPGWVQQLFGTGLRTGRYFAIFTTVMMLPPVWLTVRRLSKNPWLGVGVIWAMALNTVAIKSYGVAASQGLVACLLAWVMFLTLGDNRPRWQLLLGAFLAGVTVMVRVNMLPLLPLLILYVLWERGWKDALWTTLSGMAVLILFHAPYWPEILKIWAAWLPRGLTPFLNTWRLPEGIPPAHTSEFPNLARLDSFFQGFRYQAVPLALAALTWFLWPLRDAWRSPSHFRAAVYLSVTLAVLILVHAWAALGNSYCVYCFSSYLFFFGLLGFFLAAVSLHAWRRQITPLTGLLAMITIFGLLLGAAFSAADTFRPVSTWLLRLPFPRLRGGKVLPGFNEFGETLSNYFNWPYQQMAKTAYVIFPLLLALLLGLLLSLAGVRLAKWMTAQASTAGTSRITGVLILFAASIFILSPTPWLGGAPTLYDCQPDAITLYETAGEHLARSIPPGTRVYWRVYNPVVLLYAQQVEVNYPQVYLLYNFSNQADADTLLRFGWWSDELDQRWLDDAEYILVEARFFQENNRYKSRLSAGIYEELVPTTPMEACRDGTFIRILHRLP